MKSWREEKLCGSAQGAKALREYTGSDGGYKAVYDFAYGVFAIAREDVHNEFDDKYDSGTVEHAITAALADAFDLQ